MAVKGNKNKMIQSGNYLGSISRTKVKNFYDYRATFKAGDLFPFFCQEIYPSFNQGIDCAELVRSITPLGPTMDNAYLDVFFFFVPSRLIWDHWEEFIAGYNKEAWAQDVVYTVPQIKFYTESTEKAADIYIGSFLDYLPGACPVQELPNLQYQYYDSLDTETYGAKELNKLVSISALPARAYAKIWNDWFRDENLQDELQIYTGDNDEYNDDFCFNLLSADALPKANKLHNRFTSALPQPQKGPDVLIPMNDLKLSAASSDYSIDGLKLYNSDKAEEASLLSWSTENQKLISRGASGASTGFINKTNIVASNVSNTIRMLRLATQTELLLARDARGGTRYTESILSHFKVHNGDARLQRSEYLGSRSIPLNVQQVTNTSQADSNALGNVGGQSVTKDNYFYYSKGFSEWGIVLGLATVRTNLSYSSGIRKMYQRKERFDFIWPEFKHLGDVSLLTRELMVNATLQGYEDEVFGYVPYGSELRTGYNSNSGMFRDGLSGSLSYLTYQESYHGVNVRPVLNYNWIPQPSSVVSNTLTVQSGPQYYALFHIEEELVIPLDPTSDPGLMDHF